MVCPKSQILPLLVSCVAVVARKGGGPEATTGGTDGGADRQVPNRGTILVPFLTLQNNYHNCKFNRVTVSTWFVGSEPRAEGEKSQF